MKCKYCGGNLGLEDELCPYCGRVNELAHQHVQDMKQYSGEFAETKKDVYKTTRRFSGVAVRMIILTALIIAIAVMFFLTCNAYSLARDAKERDAKRNADVYIQKLDEMLVTGDYRGVANFAEAHCINFWIQEYDSYEQIIDAAKMYTRAVQYLMNSQIGDSYTQPLYEVGYFASALSDFYLAIESDRYGEKIDQKKTDLAIADMRENLNALMKAYLGLTDEEIKKQETMTVARRTVFFQDKYEALFGSDDGEGESDGQ